MKIQYKENEDDEWEDMNNPPSVYKTHLKSIAEDWGFSVREIDDNGIVTWEYHPYSATVSFEDELNYLRSGGKDPFVVICDETNNAEDNLKDGVINVTVLLKPVTVDRTMLDKIANAVRDWAKTVLNSEIN